MIPMRFVGSIVAISLLLMPRFVIGATPALMTEAAHNFIVSLAPEQKAKALLAFDADERRDWHFIPKARKGIPLKELSPAQQHLAHAFMSAGLSQRGYIKATTIMSLEDILRDLETGRSGGPVRDVELYYFTIFGEPSAAGTWGWSVEGHHISLNFTVVAGKMIATTPAFFGSNPAEVKSGPRKGLRVLGREENLARDLMAALDAKQRTTAIIDAKAPADTFTTNQRKVEPLDSRGLAVSQMNQSQRQILISILEEYANNMPPNLADERMQKLRAAGLEKVVFAWAGSVERGQGHYYRIQGPTFLVEYDNTQNDANHVHSVWRDFNGDWGADLLAEHYKSAPHHQKP
jgi:hypothetical protein